MSEASKGRYHDIKAKYNCPEVRFSHKEKGESGIQQIPEIANNLNLP